MSVFFDIENQDDLKLLHASIRDHDEIGNVVDKVEWEVINAFTQRDRQATGNYRAFFEYESGSDPNADLKVRLIGYNADNPENSDEGLKEALKRVIAEISTWSLRSYSNESKVSSIRQGNRAITYAGQVPSYNSFPTGWASKLKNYDARIETYAI